MKSTPTSQNKIDSVMGKLSRYDTVFLGADKPDIDHISQQIDRLEQSKSELADIEKLIIEIEVHCTSKIYPWATFLECQD